MFVSRPNQWITLPEILALYISQFGARIKEIRASGMDIENRTETIDGVKHSWYRYNTKEYLYQDKFGFARNG